MLDKLKMDFPTPNQSRDIEVHTFFLILNNMKVATIYLLNGILGRNFCKSTFQEGKHKQVCALPKQRELTEFFTIKLGLSQSLMVQERSHNPNVTLKGYPKKFWGLFGQKAHKTQLITLKTQ